MKHLQAVGAQLGMIGRCALIGVLAGTLAGQAVAQGAPAAASDTTQQATTAGTLQTPAATPATTAASAPDATSQAAALPEAPLAANESASTTMPPDLKAMMKDAGPDGQNLQSTQTTTTRKGVQRPGMLVMGIAGVPLIILGAMILSLNVGPKEAGARDGLGAAFLAPGAAMSGLGFYFAFHKKNQ